VVKIIATGCIHYPENKEKIEKSIEKIEDKVEAIFLLGDIADTLVNYLEFYDLIKDKAKKIIGIFGNIEKNKEEIIKNCKKIEFLDDSQTKFDKFLVVGTTGSCEEGFDKGLHLKRLKFVEEKLKLGKKYYQTILLMHYVPSRKLVIEEKNFGKMGSDSYEKIILDGKPSIVFYAHSHFSLPLQTIKGIPFVNTSFYVNDGLILLNIE